MDNKITVPVTSRFYQEAQKDLCENFHPRMKELHDLLTLNTDLIRSEIEAKNWLNVFDGEMLDEPVLGVDASTVSPDYGEISTALAVGVVSSTNEQTPPNYFYQSVFGTSSETFSKVASYLRVAQELAALRYASASDCWVMYDGSFTSLNWDLCKFAASMPKSEEFVSSDSSFLEWELLQECYKRCLASYDSDWFTVFGNSRGKGCDRIIAISKQGVSKLYSKELKSLKGIADNAFVPSDKLVLGLVLKEDEYTTPRSYEAIFDKSHGSNVPGYGKPATGSRNLEKQHNLVELTFKNMRVVNYKPWVWSPVMAIHYNKDASKLEEVLGVVKAQTQTKSVLEPMPLYLADLLAKQAVSVVKLYGEINVGRYPNLFKAFRTSVRK